MVDPLAAWVGFLLFGEGSGEVRMSSGSEGSGSGSGLSIGISMAEILAWLTPEMLRGTSSHNDYQTIQYLYPVYLIHPGPFSSGFWEISKWKFWRDCSEENDCKTWYVCFIVQPSPFAMRISFFRIFTLIFYYHLFPQYDGPLEYVSSSVCVRDRWQSWMCKRTMVYKYV